MKYPPRIYQRKAIDMSQQALRLNQRAILCMPTGSGKTVTFMEMAERAVIKGKRCMILADRVELIGQAAEKANDYGLYPTIIDPGYRGKTSPLYVASVQTLANRTPPDIDFLIIDEAHKLIFNKVLDHAYPKVKTIGATATPVRSYKNSLHLHYQDLIVPTSIPDLLQPDEDGMIYLTPCRTVAPQEAVDCSDVAIKRNSLTGEEDFNTEEQFKKFNKPKVYGAAVDQYLKFIPGQKTIVFCINIEHSIKTVEEFRARGIEAYHIDGTMNKWLRKKIIDDFKDPNRFFVLVNCEILTTGLDVPSLTGVIMFRDTFSYALWKQIGGRGSRLFPGKDFFTIIDMGKNHVRHGFWEDDKQFKLITDKPKRGATEGVAPVKECPHCECIMHASKPSCNFCGHVFPVKEQTFLEGDFVVVKTPILVKDKNAGKPKFYEMSDEELIQYGIRMNYKPYWAIKKIELRSKQEQN